MTSDIGFLLLCQIAFWRRIADLILLPSSDEALPETSHALPRRSLASDPWCTVQRTGLAFLIASATGVALDA